MRWLFSFIILVSAGNILFGQGQPRLHEYLIAQDNKLFQIRNQEKIQVEEKLYLHNGTIVNTDGTFMTITQKHHRLQNGECLDLEGNHYKSLKEYEHHQQELIYAMNQQHVMLKDGQIYLIENQQRSPLSQPLKLKNGTIVKTDGVCVQKNGKKFRLYDGECLDTDGNRYENQQKFWDKMENRYKDKANEEKITGYSN